MLLQISVIDLVLLQVLVRDLVVVGWVRDLVLLQISVRDSVLSCVVAGFG